MIFLKVAGDLDPLKDFETYNVIWKSVHDPSVTMSPTSYPAMAAA